MSDPEKRSNDQPRKKQPPPTASLGDPVAGSETRSSRFASGRSWDVKQQWPIGPADQ
ncbi:MAG TPA: hypothetical protein VMW72_04095 [Sedimentisphaerales bacterium]|nr:hypothetical protein [Sedimentisphaerales bacterium]